MNPLLLLIIIIETILGVSATLYVVIGLPAYIIWKVIKIGRASCRERV